VTGLAGLRPVRPAVGALSLALAFIAFPSVTHASPSSAEKAYQKGNFVQAAKD